LKTTKTQKDCPHCVRTSENPGQKGTRRTGRVGEGENELRDIKGRKTIEKSWEGIKGKKGSAARTRGKRHHNKKRWLLKTTETARKSVVVHGNSDQTRKDPEWEKMRKELLSWGVRAEKGRG